MSSVSRINLVLEVKGKSKVKVELKRHLSPRTIGILQRSIPLDGNAHFLGKSIIYLESMIDSGIERGKRDFKKGDVAFMPAQGSICFFINNAEGTKTMSPIGQIVENIDSLYDVRPGDVLSLYAET